MSQLYHNINELAFSCNCNVNSLYFYCTTCNRHICSHCSNNGLGLPAHNNRYYHTCSNIIYYLYQFGEDASLDEEFFQNDDEDFQNFKSSKQDIFENNK